MKILVLNGSPRANGNTRAMVDAFAEGAHEAGHAVEVVDVCRKQVAGCRGCEYCHTKGDGACVQRDDMAEIVDAINASDMLVLASPIYYFGLTAQLQAVVHRFYAQGVFPSLSKTALFLSSGSSDVYDGVVYEYRKTFTEWMKIEDAGIFTAHGSQNKSEAKLAELRAFGREL